MDPVQWERAFPNESMYTSSYGRLVRQCNVWRKFALRRCHISICLCPIHSCISPQCVFEWLCRRERHAGGNSFQIQPLFQNLYGFVYMSLVYKPHPSVEMHNDFYLIAQSPGGNSSNVRSCKPRLRRMRTFLHWVTRSRWCSTASYQRRSASSTQQVTDADTDFMLFT